MNRKLNQKIELIINDMKKNSVNSLQELYNYCQSFSELIQFKEEEDLSEWIYDNNIWDEHTIKFMIMQKKARDDWANLEYEKKHSKLKINNSEFKEILFNRKNFNQIMNALNLTLNMNQFVDYFIEKNIEDLKFDKKSLPMNDLFLNHFNTEFKKIEKIRLSFLHHMIKEEIQDEKQAFLTLSKSIEKGSIEKKLIDWSMKNLDNHFSQIVQFIMLVNVFKPKYFIEKEEFWDLLKKNIDVSEFEKKYKYYLDFKEYNIEKKENYIVLKNHQLTKNEIDQIVHIANEIIEENDFFISKENKKPYVNYNKKSFMIFFDEEKKHKQDLYFEIFQKIIKVNFSQLDITEKQFMIKNTIDEYNILNKIDLKQENNHPIRKI